MKYKVCKIGSVLLLDWILLHEKQTLLKTANFNQGKFLYVLKLKGLALQLSNTSMGESETVLVFIKLKKKSRMSLIGKG